MRVRGNQTVSLCFSLQTKNSKEVLWDYIEGLSETGDCSEWVRLLILRMD